MDGKPTTFWEHIYDLRSQRRIPRVWRAADLRMSLEEEFSPNTIKVYPSNCSISMEGHGIGDYVKNGQAPKMWRMGRGLFQLVADPEDDEETRQADRERASMRARELRAQKMHTSGSRDEASTSQPAPLDLPTRQTVSSPGSPDLYPSIPITITSEARQALAGLTTPDEKAMKIVEGYFLVKYGDQAKIDKSQDGEDFSVSIDGQTERIEVKGTDEATIAWSEFEVSNQKSHDALKDGGASMYRVVDVSGTNPRIYILTYGQHFTLELEPRWAVKRVPSKDDPYPLRGEPYRYELPYDPVAADEWEVQK